MLVGILISLRSSLESLIKLKVFWLVSLRGVGDKIDPQIKVFVGGFLLITKFGCLLEVFIGVSLFFERDH